MNPFCSSAIWISGGNANKRIGSPRKPISITRRKGNHSPEARELQVATLDVDYPRLIDRIISFVPK